MANLIFLVFGIGLLLLLDRIMVWRLHKIEANMNEFNFVMRPPKWMRSLGLIWIAIGVFVIIITVRDSLLGLGLGFALIGITALGMKPFSIKIVVQGKIIIFHRFFRKIKFSFNRITNATMSANIKCYNIIIDQYVEVKCYSKIKKKNNTKKLKFTSDWFGFNLMMQRLFDLGILPWLETNENKKDRMKLTALMDFLIKHNLTTWYSFNKKEALKYGFKLHFDDLTKEGEYLFMSGAVARWVDFAYQGGDVSDFSLLKDALINKKKEELKAQNVYEGRLMRMTLLEAINVRTSRRKYVGGKLEAAHVEKLQNLIKEYNGIGGFRIELILNNGEAFKGFTRSYGMLSGVNHYFGFIAKDYNPYADEKIGYYGELLVLHATTLGLGTCWVGGTFNKSKTPFELTDDERLACLITVGKVDEKPSSKEKFIHKLTHRKEKSESDMFKSDGPVPDWFSAGMAAVVRAPSAMNKQPVMFTYKDGRVKASVDNSAKYLVGFDLGIAKLHFELGAGGGNWEWGSDGEFIRE